MALQIREQSLGEERCSDRGHTVQLRAELDLEPGCPLDGPHLGPCRQDRPEPDGEACDIREELAL